MRDVYESEPSVAELMSVPLTARMTYNDAIHQTTGVEAKMSQVVDQQISVHSFTSSKYSTTDSLVSGSFSWIVD